METTIVPARVCSTGEGINMHYHPVISSVPASHICSTGEGVQYQRVILSVLARHIRSIGKGVQYRQGNNSKAASSTKFLTFSISI